MNQCQTLSHLVHDTYRGPMKTAILEQRIRGKLSTRFFQELFGNSIQYPLANILLEAMIASPLAYMQTLDPYFCLLAGIIQAYWLAEWENSPHPHRFLGNLIGPAFYSIVGIILEGSAFLSMPGHQVYWIFSLVIGLLQALHYHIKGWLCSIAIVTEAVARSSILLVMYIIFEMSGYLPWLVLPGFLHDRSHFFVTIAIPLLGLSVGLSQLTSQRYLTLLRETADQLKVYSEWLLGRDLLGAAVVDPTALSLTRRNRTVLFMDIRGFTSWSETHAPEEVIAMLKGYYGVAEEILKRYRVIKFKYSADEVMAVFPTAQDAVQAARELRDAVARIIGNFSLGAGIGIHSGVLMEGLMGSESVQGYDVLGDTVNTAKRIEGACESAEILLSQATRDELSQDNHTGPSRQISVKGKQETIHVYLLD